MCGHTPHSELILDLFKTFCFYSFCLHFKTLLTLLNFLSLNFYFKFVTFSLRLFLHPLSFGSSFFSPFIIYPDPFLFLSVHLLICFSCGSTGEWWLWWWWVLKEAGPVAPDTPRGKLFPGRLHQESPLPHMLTKRSVQPNLHSSKGSHYLGL